MKYHYYRLIDNFNDYFTTGDKVLLNNQECLVTKVDKGVIEIQEDKTSKFLSIDDLYDCLFYKDEIHYLPLD